MSTTMNTDYPIFLGSEIDQPDPNKAMFHVLPVPFEKTVSYGGGTGKGPAAILDASWQLEEWDGKSKPCDAGIYTCAPVDCSVSAEQVIENIAKATADIVRHGAMPVVLGGEHTVTYGVLKGLKDAGVDDFGIVQIDAHADLRQAYEGDLLSHASVMKRAVDMGIPLYQLGIRAFCEEEIAFREEFGVLYEVVCLDRTLPKGVSPFSSSNNVLWHALLEAISQYSDALMLPLICCDRVI